MKSSIFSIILVISLLIISPVQKISATDAGQIQGSFGFGTRIDFTGAMMEESLAAAQSHHIQWIATDLSWQRYISEPIYAAQAEVFFLRAAQYGFQVMVSLTDPAAEALTSAGPDPRETTQFLVNLISDFPVIQAVEVFPAANTAHGWGAAPNPATYLATLEMIQAGLETKVLIIAGGLVSIEPNQNSSAIHEEEFLEALYNYQGRSLMPIISIQYPTISGDANTWPSGEQDVLRRYETIRELMLRHDHADGSIWITDLSWPIQSDLSEGEQASWFSQALRRILRQPYIGFGFFGELNPRDGQQLISHTGDTHPAFTILEQRIILSNPTLLLEGGSPRRIAPRSTNDYP